MLTKETVVLVQGMTGKEGTRASELMIESGITLSAGVTPGKGGQEVHGKPIFNSVQEAKEHDPAINTSVLYVPPLFVYGAAMEAMDAGIELLIIISENVPVQDTAKLIEHARTNGKRVIGPASIGIMNTALGKIGSIGFPGQNEAYSKGNIGIISKSGGMSGETANILTQAGLGQSTVVGIGGDMLIGTTFTDVLDYFEQDEGTAAVVMFGEFGGRYEQHVAQHVHEKKFTKPVIAFIGGQFAETLNRSLALGHAGAIVDKENTANAKKRILQDAGVLVADYHYQIPELVQEALQ
ncbi:MAG: CoA-binding protein [Candidatus Woesearchaeota archaeon]|nr:CoA-binding protein [Candidatus Woesearchaeota archaeon]